MESPSYPGKYSGWCSISGGSYVAGEVLVDGAAGSAGACAGGERQPGDSADTREEIRDGSG